MNTTIDACTFIGLVRSELLAQVIRIPTRSFVMGPLVLDECGPDSPIALQLAADKALTILDDAILPVSLFSSMFFKYGLGDGETECLAFAKNSQLAVATDDGKARRAVETEFGLGFLTGSIGLLKEACQATLIDANQAYSGYKLMREKGSFLPKIALAHFK